MQTVESAETKDNQRQPMWRRPIWQIVAGCIVLSILALLNGCGEPAHRTLPASQTTTSNSQKEFFQSGIDMLFRLEEYDSDKALTQIVERLNESSLADDQSVAWKRDPLIASLPKELKKRPFISGLNKFSESPNFDSDYDGEFLQQAAWTQQIALDVTAGETDPIQMATMLFQWTIRNIQIEPDTKEETPKNYVLLMHQPWETLMFGRGTATQRAWLFMLLLRQANLDSALVDVKGDASPHLVAVANEHQLYLYDTLWGIPLALPRKPAATKSADAKSANATSMEFASPYTLSQLAENPDLLRQFDVDGTHKYPFMASDFDRVSLLLEASPGFLAHRMRIVQSRLKNDQKMVLSVSPSSLAETLGKFKHVVEVKLWMRPLEITSERARIADVDEDSKDAETKRARALRDAIVENNRIFSSGGPLRIGRLMQFRSLFEAVNPSKQHPGEMVEARNQRGAKAHYMAARPADFDIEKLAEQRKLSPQAALQSVIETRQDATYWLGIITFEQGEYRSAVDFFLNRTLEQFPGGPWTAGARYNLGQTYEAIGEIDKATAVYLADHSPQQSGNWLRAKWLRHPPEEVKSTETKPDDKRAPAESKEPAREPATEPSASSSADPKEPAAK